MPDAIAAGNIDQQAPENTEDHDGGETHAFRESTDEEPWSDEEEHHLVGKMREHGNGGRIAARSGVRRDAIQKRMLQAANESIAIGKRQAVSAGQPEQAHDTCQSKALHEKGQDVLGFHQSRIEQSEAGNHHEEDQRGGCQHPRGVAGINRGRRGRFGGEERRSGGEEEGWKDETLAEGE